MRGPILLFAKSAAELGSLSNELQERGFGSQFLSDREELCRQAAVNPERPIIAKTSEAVSLCEEIHRHSPSSRVMVMQASQDDQLEAMRADAFDCLATPIDMDQLELTLHRALHRQELLLEVDRIRTALSESTGFEELVGASQPMHKLYELLSRAAGTSSSVLITGESGTGKELIARALHRRSGRKEGPFVAINCSAIPENLVESELFGHAKGAYTDAKAARAGLFVQAHGGTVFLDEVGDLPISVQPKLLRALQERKVRPVGSSEEVAFDVRIISATNENIELAVEEKRFREDLLYRLNVIQLQVPPLRERTSDIPLLAQHYLEHYAIHLGKEVRSFSRACSERLLTYPWPGNVRELQNCVERAVALAPGEEIEREDLPEKIRDYQRSHVLVVGDHPTDLVSMAEVERRYIQRVMQAVGGNKREAARILGFDRKTLYRKLERYQIEVERKESSAS